jgi:osmoprotectant transport system permease protein
MFFILIPISVDGATRIIGIGSKKFTESVILGEISAQLISDAGYGIEHRWELGGTRVLFNALKRGEIDIYPEYTGTIREEILRDLGLTGDEEIAAALKEMGISMTAPLGFNNTYSLGMKPELADSLAIRTISDLGRHPQLRFGFTNEFMDRGDGWPSLKMSYHLPHENVRGLDHDLAYRALQSGSIDLMDLYSTDAEIAYYGLRVIEDDRAHFPIYNAVYLYRSELDREAPNLIDALVVLTGEIDERAIRSLNARVKIEGESEATVASDYLAVKFGLTTIVAEKSLLQRIWQRTVEHLFLVGVAMTLGILVAIPAGITAAKRNRTGQVILSVTGIIQTIPSLALLVFMIPLLGIAAPPAIAALFLYSLLPMVRNTHAGLKDIPLQIEESADALGLTPKGRLFKIELPMASRSILAGIKTSAVITVGFATLGALIGAGGYGQPILTGIRLDDYGLILEGAVPAALLALAVQLLFDLSERILIPRGLRLRREL